MSRVKNIIIYIKHDKGYFYIYKPQKLLINFEVVDVEKQKWFVKNYCRYNDAIKVDKY